MDIDHAVFRNAFRTGRSKSRLNLLSLLRAGQDDYIINDAALDYMRQRKVAPDVIGKLAAHPETSFASQMAWYDHLVRLRLDVFDRTLVRELTEAALWGAVRHHGLMGNTVVVSDDAGQFRIPNHALCWVHAERLLQKLMPKTPEQTRKLDKVRDQVWALYRDLKLWKQKPSAKEASPFPETDDAERWVNRASEYLAAWGPIAAPALSHAAIRQSNPCANKSKVRGPGAMKNVQIQIGQ